MVVRRSRLRSHRAAQRRARQRAVRIHRLATRIRAVNSRRVRSTTWCALALMCMTARADPWLSPGDEGLRSDIELLADAGILRGPVTTWPVSWPDLARDALAASDQGLDDATRHALLRVQRRSRDASSPGFAGMGIRVRGAYEPATLREFADTP